MQNNTDAYGNALMDCFLGNEDHYAIEREDGYLDVGDLKYYFSEFNQWGEIEKRMPEFVSGRVLDVKEYDPLLLSLGAISVDTEGSLDDVISKIIEVIKG